MSQRQRAFIFHFRIVPIVAALVIAASGDIRAFAQPDQNASGVNAQRPSAAPPADATAPKPSTEGIPATVVDGDQVQGILGKQVRSSAGEDMGRIVDVIVDPAGRVRAAVIDFGGFLGVGNRQIAVAWSAIRFSVQGKPDMLVLDFTRDQLRVAPAYKAGEQIVLLGAPGNPNSSTAGGPPDKDPPSRDSPPK